MQHDPARRLIQSDASPIMDARPLLTTLFARSDSCFSDGYLSVSASAFCIAYPLLYCFLAFESQHLRRVLSTFFCMALVVIEKRA